MRIRNRLMAAGGVCRIVVWERQRRDGGFSPFPPHDSATIEAAHTARSATYVDIGGGTVDLKNMKMKQQTTRSRGECAIRRSTTSIPASSPPILAYWTWDEGGHNFAVYSIEAIIDIEQAHQGQSLTVNLSQCPCGLPYTIDFSTMTQTRHRYMTKRVIRREPLRHGQSLQTLLAAGSVGHSLPQTSSVGGVFSLAVGPATSLLSSAMAVATNPLAMFSSAGSGGSGGSASGQASSSSTGSTAATSSRRGRRKNKHSAASTSPPLGRGNKTDTGVSQVPEYVVLVKSLSKEEDGPCPICMCQLLEQSGYDEGEGGGGGGSVKAAPVPYAPPVDLCKLRKCGHMMHRPCLLMMLKSESAKDGLTCPTCKKVYGIKTGDMPNGTMSVRTTHGSLPGHEGRGTIEIVYNFSPGVHNGRRYRANAFPRTCYLPNSEKGQKVLRLLKLAWERRLTFTIGTSVTTGATDTVVWNEIHHKTESSSNHSGHGYPDPNYLDNVLMELSLQGVTESDSDDSL